MLALRFCEQPYKKRRMPRHFGVDAAVRGAAYRRGDNLAVQVHSRGRQEGIDLLRALLNRTVVGSGVATQQALDRRAHSCRCHAVAHLCGPVQRLPYWNATASWGSRCPNVRVYSSTRFIFRAARHVVICPMCQNA
jgi:hypothetical protein